MANTAVVYDRSIDSRILNFEASGALMSASLVMRDRETDSWWSIMSSKAIGGPLDGARLSELAISEKTTWADWVDRYPQTRVLSVAGEEHIDSNPYDNYFASDDTFRGIGLTDDRLAAKQPVFAFWIDGHPFAAPFDAFEDGRFFRIDDGRSVLLTRPVGAPILASSRGYLIDASVELSSVSPQQLLARLDQFGIRVHPLDGFDTYWYTWISVNPKSRLLQ